MGCFFIEFWHGDGKFKVVLACMTQMRYMRYIMYEKKILGLVLPNSLSLKLLLNPNRLLSDIFLNSFLFVNALVWLVLLLKTMFLFFCNDIYSVRQSYRRGQFEPNIWTRQHKKEEITIKLSFIIQEHFIYQKRKKILTNPINNRACKLQLKINP